MELSIFGKDTWFFEIMSCFHGIVKRVVEVVLMVSSPSFDFPPASFSWKALPSPSVCEAPIPGEVASAAEDAGASFFCVRPSSRSFSKWVAVAYFSNPGAASELAKKLSELCGFPFCVVRSVDEWQLVSVPVSVAAFSYRVGSELPCLFSAF